MSYFYEGVGEGEPHPITARERMVLEIARNFTGIENERYQEALHQLPRALAAEEGQARGKETPRE